MTKNLPILDFILKNYKNFNSRATRDATIAYLRHIESGGKMFWAVAGAMSSAQLGITLAPAIRAGLVHGLSVTGANLEESLFRLVAHHSYKDFPDYRYLTKDDDIRFFRFDDSNNIYLVGYSRTEGYNKYQGKGWCVLILQQKRFE
jgi:deoxyhypusine synthase